MRFYKNNGYIYDTRGKSNAHQHVGALSVRYDGFIYYGNMESFNFELNEDNELGGVEFSIEFTANGIVDTTPETTMVYPMRAPLPNIEDQRFSGINSGGRNRPGEYAFGIGDGGARITTQGREVNPGDVLDTLVPPSATGPDGRPLADPTTIGMTNGTPDQPVGSQGFQDPGTLNANPGARSVQQGSSGNAKPFGFY